MPEQDILKERRLAQEKALYRYISALDRGDIDTVLTVLHEAENDPVLEQMIFDTHASDLDQHVTQPDIVYLQEEQSSSKSSEPVYAVGQITRQPRPKKKRWPVLIQMLAAALIAAVLIGGSVLLFQPHRSSTTTVAVHTATQEPDIVVSIDPTVRVIARNIDSGAILWQKTPSPKIPNDYFSQYSNGGGLVIQNHVVYIAFAEYVYAFQLSTGKQLWNQHLIPTISRSPIGGSRPLMVADQHSVYISGYIGNQLYVLDQKTGALRWQFSAGTNAPPPLLALANGIAYVQSNADVEHNAVKALDSSNGHVLWTSPTTMPVSATVADNTLYIQAVHSRIHDPARQHKELPMLAFNAQTGKLIWSVIVPLIFSSPLNVVGKTVVVSYNQHYCAYQVTTGAQAWCSKDMMGSNFNVSLRNMFLVNGNIYGIAFYDQTSHPSKNQPAHPVNLGMLIHAIKGDNGDILWTKKLSADIFVSAITPSALIVCDTSNHLQAISLKDGHLIWQVSISPQWNEVMNIAVGSR